MEYPQINHLYKYCPYNTNSLSILINKKIWVAKPYTFNDPFDCKIRFKSEINSEAFRKYLERTGRKTGNIYGDYEMFQEGLNEFRDIDVQNLGVFSMSQIRDNILMWSHYADQHKGFCIEFKRLPNNDLGDFEKTLPVNYYCEYPEMAPFDSNGNIDINIRKKMLFSKAKDWAYEKEWRLTYPEGDKKEMLPADISSIIFGLRMPDGDKNTIRNILADQPGMRYQKAIEVEYQFRLKIVDV
jgi:hypothetical protein